MTRSPRRAASSAGPRQCGAHTGGPATRAPQQHHKPAIGRWPNRDFFADGRILGPAHQAVRAGRARGLSAVNCRAAVDASETCCCVRRFQARDPLNRLPEGGRRLVRCPWRLAWDPHQSAPRFMIPPVRRLLRPSRWPSPHRHRAALLGPEQTRPGAGAVRGYKKWPRHPLPPLTLPSHPPLTAPPLITDTIYTHPYLSPSAFDLIAIVNAASPTRPPSFPPPPSLFHHGRRGSRFFPAVAPSHILPSTSIGCSGASPVSLGARAVFRCGSRCDPRRGPDVIGVHGGAGKPHCRRACSCLPAVP